MHPAFPKCTLFFRNAPDSRENAPRFSGMHPTLRKMHPAFSEMHPEKSKMHPSLFFGAFFYQNMSTKPNKHRDFDTKSRCSFFASMPRNIRVFKVSRLKLSPAELFSTGDFVLFIEVDAHPYKSQRGFYGDNVSIMGANVGFVGLTCI